MQSFEKEPYIVQFLSVGRVLQEFDRLLVGCRFFFGNVAESEVLVRALIGEQHPVVERVLRSQVMTQYNVGEFVTEHGCQTGLIGKHIDEPAADHNGISHTECFQRGSEQNACPYRARQVDVIGDFEIVDDRLQNAIHVAFRSEQSSIGEPLHHVVFRLLLPGPFGL